MLREAAKQMVNVKWQQVEEFVTYVVERSEVQQYEFAGVYAVPRGGLVLGVMISHAMDLPMLAAPCAGCLVVDDIVDTGAALEKMNSQGHIIASMFYRKGASFTPDMWLIEKRDEWIHFPWEFEVAEETKAKAKPLAAVEAPKASLDENEQAWMNEVIYDEPGVACACASALAAYFNGDAPSFKSWLVNLSNRIFWPGAWDKNICYDALNTNYDKFVPLLAEACVWCVKAKNPNNVQFEEYKDVMDKVAELVKGNNASVASYCDKIDKSHIDSKVREACLALRFYFLAKYHSDGKSLRNPQFDWDEFKQHCDNCNIAPEASARDRAMNCVRKVSEFVVSKMHE